MDQMSFWKNPDTAARHRLRLVVAARDRPVGVHHEMMPERLGRGLVESGAQQDDGAAEKGPRGQRQRREKEEEDRKCL
jgi:hypothetical protein